ncbi:MAG TPA: ABC transporter permease subunit [Candidatus Solibacter sp.]|jgi:ABC-2 type transport system permease protein|nr:ABC transporter permease subunit [Candidatus Solibacter sp.]
MRRATRFTYQAFLSHWRGILVIGVGFGVLVVQQATQFTSLFGSGATNNADAVAGMQSLARTFAVAIPPPRRVDTVAGFVDWRLLGASTIYLAIYALITGAAALRGEEETGLVDSWLGTGLGRSTLVIGRILAFGLALAAAAALAALISIAGTQAAGLPLPPGPLAITLFMLVLPALFYFALSMLVTQVLPSRRGATGLVAALAGSTFVLANLSYVVAGLSVIRWVSPFFYFDQGHALAEGTEPQPAYAGALLLATALVTIAAAAVFRWRDVGAPLIRSRDRHHEQAGHFPFYPRRLLTATIWELRWTIVGWTSGIVLLAALDTASIKPVTEGFGTSTALKTYLARLGGGESQLALGFLSFAVFVLGATLVATAAINVVARFAADQQERRVEALLAQPLRPLDVQLARIAALLVAAVVPTGAMFVAVVFTAKWFGIDLHAAHLRGATLMVLPLALAVGVAGVAMLPRFTRLAVWVLSAALGLSVVVVLVGAMSAWGVPDWATRLTLLRAYGRPAVQGIDTSGLAVLLVLLGAGLVAIAVQARSEMTAG